jgi:hypothetical protein
MIPREQSNPDWYGVTQLYVSIPSQGVNGQFIGQAELRAFPVATFKRVRFDLPASLVTKLKATYSDLSFKIVLNVPTGAPGVYRFDAIRFQAEQDIDVTYISRTPAMDYDASPNQPVAGAPITWVGHIRNRGTKSLGSFQYRWLVNGKQVATGTVPSLAVGASTTVSLPSTWTNTVTDITLTADPANLIAEGSEANNTRTIRNNALMLGFWVEESTRNFFDEHQFDFQSTYGINDGANSWEDWAIRQQNRWNQSLAAAVFPSAPQGGLDRVRLEKVTVVPDGALPIGAPGSGLPAGNYPDTSDKTVDMMWGFPIQDGIHLDFHNPVDPQSAFNVEPSLVHELNHARFLIDSYIMDVTDYQIDVLDANGNRLFPDDSECARRASPNPSMMHSTTWDYAEFEIDWLNVWARQRAQPGWANYNAHFGGDGYMMTTPRKIPTQNRLRILGANGAPLVGGRVRVYQTLPSEEEKTIDNTPEYDVLTGSDGMVNLGSQPFGIPNEDLHGGACEYGVDFVLVTKNGQQAMGWLDLPQVNVAYFRGQTQTATYDMKTSL